MTEGTGSREKSKDLVKRRNKGKGQNGRQSASIKGAMVMGPQVEEDPQENREEAGMWGSTGDYQHCPISVPLLWGFWLRVWPLSPT